MRESEWIQIGVDTGAGKTAWTRVSQTGERFLATVTSLSAQQLENLSSLASDCTSKVAMIGESISKFEVFSGAALYATVVCWRVHVDGCSLYHDKGFLFHKGSTVVAKKIDAWIQKEMRDSQYNGCTVAYKERTTRTASS